MSIKMALPQDISFHSNAWAQLFLTCKLNRYGLSVWDHMNYSQVQLPLSDRQDINLSVYLHHSLLSLPRVSSVCSS